MLKGLGGVRSKDLGKVEVLRPDLLSPGKGRNVTTGSFQISESCFPAQGQPSPQNDQMAIKSEYLDQI